MAASSEVHLLDASEVWFSLARGRRLAALVGGPEVLQVTHPEGLTEVQEGLGIVVRFQNGHPIPNHRQIIQNRGTGRLIGNGGTPKEQGQSHHGGSIQMAENGGGIPQTSGIRKDIGTITRGTNGTARGAMFRIIRGLAMNEIRDTPILVDFYVGAYGPTIRIVLDTPEQLQTFVKMLRSLDSTEGVVIALEELPTFVLLGMKSFILRTVSSTSELAKLLTVLNSENSSVMWRQTSGGWKRAADRIEVFLNSAEPGHHYLTEEGVDDALVEVAYRE